MGWYFTFFFISGFCGILYELVWLRLAMAQFGATTALVSTVLSMFMAGLGAGSWIAAILLPRYGERISSPPLRLYALAEVLIGCSALTVPVQLLWGHRLLEWTAERAALSSATYYLASGACVALTIIPWCACMGATIPLAMFAIRSDSRYETRRSFSLLYLANVSGAVFGAICPLFLIELHGFHRTLRVGALLNALIAACAFGISFAHYGRGAVRASAEPRITTNASGQGKRVLLLLFATGLTTMGMEVIWIRLFAPYVGALVYSFATILASYLVATFVGSCVYRDSSRAYRSESQTTWIVLALLGLLPLLTSDPRVPLNYVVRVVLGVAPFAGVIGFLTPMLVDRWSAGDPDRAGRAYAVNVLGCIVGPLLSGFVLLPVIGEHGSMLLFVLPWFAMASPRHQSSALRTTSRISTYTIVGAALMVFVFAKDYEASLSQRVVLRDSTATVIATGTGMNKLLLINGTGMTKLTPVPKMMAHLTLSSLDQPPRNALVICFGMGTTYRSLISWGIPTTVVELVPSVPKLFTYYHSDGATVMASPLSRVVIDDGRRYLERSPQKYDAIIIDPPPPVPAAGSSLLYSEEFYAIARERLGAGGILQQWLPAESAHQVQASVARALRNSFPYVRVFESIEHSGWHFLASERPMPTRSAAELIARMPASAVGDMMEWGPAKTPEQQFERVLSIETTTGQMIARSPTTPALQDDRPINEYFLLRLLSRSDEPGGLAAGSEDFH